MSSSEDKESGDVERHGSGHLFDGLGVITDNDDDPNFDPTAMILEDESPYPEVRSAVANTDDPTMPVSTLRAWVLGIISAVLLAGINQFFFFRYPSVVIDAYIPLLVGFPIGKLWERYVPNMTLFGVELNPGPFTIKEHVIITVMSSVADVSAYATTIIAVQKVFYNQSPSFAYQWPLVMSTQLIGFSFSGLCNRFLVDPSSMIWPNNLALAALFNTIHSLETSGTRGLGGISRERFFTYVFIGYFFYNFLPSYLFTALSSFSWVCWIVPNNVKLNQMFGVTHGLAMGVLTFDWGQITAFNGSPLPTPWWAAANNGIAVVFFSWFLVPILYYTNTWYSAFLPMVSSQAFDNTGNPYNVSRILNDDVTLNIDAYNAYSPVFISAMFAISYGLSFAMVTSTITHTLVYHRKRIWNRAQRQPDIHTRLMSVYKEVPDWWYLTIFCTMFGIGAANIEIWHADLPVWAFILALFIGFAYTIPIGIIGAMANQQIGLNVITELIIGYLLPGRPIATMMFKTWGYWSLHQALVFASNFKLGHYMKIPPRTMFFCQVVATVIAGTVQLGVQSWVFSNVEDICSPTQKDGFICPNTNVFGNASIIWGVIGPQRIFSHGQLYYGLLFFFLIGAVIPIIQWALHKRFKIGLLRYLNFPVVFSSVTTMPPATPINFVPSVLVCFLFNYVIRCRHFGWWTKYNCASIIYLLSGALDAGYAIGIVFIFFTLQYPDNGNIGLNSIQNWWGNTVFLNTADAKGTPFKTLSEGQTFGPKSW
ncbi:OPT oligopeptide transporter protein-domain-containing protein [Lactarius quietus]|nr:OPT oligopeptide transporter protein-domain-containing protein [Lactarius quietus]